MRRFAQTKFLIGGIDVKDGKIVLPNLQGFATFLHSKNGKGIRSSE